MFCLPAVLLAGWRRCAVSSRVQVCRGKVFPSMQLSSTSASSNMDPDRLVWVDLEVHICTCAAEGRGGSPIFKAGVGNFTWPVGGVKGQEMGIFWGQNLLGSKFMPCNLRARNCVCTK